MDDAAPPMAERSAMTETRSLLASVTVQVRLVVVVPLLSIVDGEKEQAEMTGGGLYAVTESDAVEVAVAD